MIPVLPVQQPPARTLSARVARVLWASFPVWSLGFLAWVPSLRLAVDQRTRSSWLIFGGITAACVAGWTVIGLTEHKQSDRVYVMGPAGVLCLLVLLIVPTVHYCLSTRVDGPHQPALVHPQIHAYQVPVTAETLRPVAKPAAGPASAPATDPEAADIQAGLRELRDILGREEA